MSPPAVTRKTSRGIPEYLDSGASASSGSDTFLLAGHDDLVPALVETAEGEWTASSLLGEVDGFRIDLFRPRVQAAYQRVERWTSLATGTAHWRTLTHDNQISLFGQSPQARIADPADERRVFSWLLEETRDGKGNLILYSYKAEDLVGLDPSDNATTANRYLKRIQYANDKPHDGSSFHYDFVLDYGEHDADDPRPNPGAERTWRLRSDAYTSNRAAFPIETRRACERLLMFHTFPELEGGKPTLVGSAKLLYDESPVAWKLRSFQQSGHGLKPDGTSWVESFPAIEFGYSPVKIDTRMRSLAPELSDELPEGVDGARYRFVDLDGEGAPGILAEQGETWRYMQPWGRASFAPLEQSRELPNGAVLSNGMRLLDLDGDGLPSLVSLEDPLPGRYERTADGGWEPFQPFETLPNVNWNDARIQWIDLSGNGHADLLIAEPDRFLWYPAKPDGSFDAVRYAPRPPDDEAPAVLFDEPGTALRVADMTGDGLLDLVRVKAATVTVFPNMGNGHFGPGKTMSNSPVLADERGLDPDRLFIHDVDGSGCADILYLGAPGNDDPHSFSPSLWFNQAGRGFGEEIALPELPTLAEPSSVQLVDLGTGTASIVWSTPLPGAGIGTLRFVDLMSMLPDKEKESTPIKPHLLVSIKSAGVETRIEYTPSSLSYLNDKRSGRQLT